MMTKTYANIHLHKITKLRILGEGCFGDLFSFRFQSLILIESQASIESYSTLRVPGGVMCDTKRKI